MLDLEEAIEQVSEWAQERRERWDDLHLTDCLYQGYLTGLADCIYIIYDWSDLTYDYSEEGSPLEYDNDQLRSLIEARAEELRIEELNREPWHPPHDDRFDPAAAERIAQMMGGFAKTIGEKLEED